MMLQIANFRVYLLFMKTFCSIVITGEIVGAYEVPPAIIVPLKPVGFTVSVPDHPGITLFAFHGNINKDFEHGREAGEMAVDVLRKKNGFWTYTNRDRKLKEGDIIYYWLYVIKDGLGYERLFQSYMVDGFGEPTSTSTTTTTTTTTTRKPPPRPTTSAPPQSVTDFIDIRNPGAGPCKLGITTVNGERACQGYLIFDSDFSQEIGRNWTKEVHFNRDESEFVVFDRRETNSYIESNHLTIQPTLLDDEYGADFTRRGPLDLTERCTSHDPLLCKQDTIGFSILPPVISARLTTKDRFSFKYGTVDIRAKLPKGNWVVPEIWLLPKAHRPYGSDKSGRIVIAKSIGNALLTYDDIPLGNSVLTAGLEVNEKTNKTFRKITYNGLWSERFHNFKLDWTPSGVIFYVDNEPYGTWEGDREPLLKGYGPVSPFDQEFYLSLGIHVGGYYDVINGAVSGGREKPWSNSHPKRLFSFYQDLKNWHATWNDQTKLKVDYIRVYAL